MRPWHKDDAYLEYDDLVEAGEIDPEEISIEEYVQNQWESYLDDADLDMER